MWAQHWAWEMAWGLSWGWSTLGKWARTWKEKEPGVEETCPWRVWGSPEWGCLCGVKQQSEVG